MIHLEPKWCIPAKIWIWLLKDWFFGLNNYLILASNLDSESVMQKEFPLGLQNIDYSSPMKYSAFIFMSCTVTLFLSMIQGSVSCFEIPLSYENIPVCVTVQVLNGMGSHCLLVILFRPLGGHPIHLGSL